MPPVLCNSSPCSTKTKYPNGLCKKHGGTYFCTYNTCNLPINKHKSQLCDIHCKCYKCTKVSISTLPQQCRNAVCKEPVKTHSPYCKVHSSSSRCPNCVDWIDSRHGNKKYDGYCATCFKRLFPNDSRVKEKNTGPHELRVRNFINEHFTDFVHDTMIYTNACQCTNRRRIDHFRLIGNTIIAIETDEHQHNTYDNEEIRYNDLYMHFSGKWIFIRFNVHSFHDNKGRFRQTKLPDRPALLKITIQQSIDKILAEQNNGLLELIKLFYDDFTYPRYTYIRDSGAWTRTLVDDY
jgi:hypothetical protein